MKAGDRAIVTIGKDRYEGVLNGYGQDRVDGTVTFEIQVLPGLSRDEISIVRPKGRRPVVGEAVSRAEFVGSLIGSFDAPVFRERLDGHFKSNEEDPMKQDSITVIRDAKSKSALIYKQVEDDPTTGKERYEVKDGSVLTREPGGEMPIYERIPDETLIPLVRAVRNNTDYQDLF